MGAGHFGSRLPPDGEGGMDHEFVLHGRWDTKTFMHDESSDTPLNIRFEATQDIESANLHPQGWTYLGEDESTVFFSTQTGKGLYGKGVPAFIILRQQFDLERHVRFTSSVPLVLHTDPDDGRELNIGDTVVGIFDTPVDIDTYTIQLSRGQRFGIRLRSVPTEVAKMTVDYPGAAHYEVVTIDERDDSRTDEGVAIEYRAPVDGIYTIAVEPTRLQGPSGYTLEVASHFSERLPVRFRRPEDAFGSPVGDLLKFQSDESPISINYPLNVTGGTDDMLGASVFEQGRRGETVAIEELDLTFFGQGLSVDDYVLRSIVLNGLPLVGEKATTRRELETPSGAPVVIEDFEADEGKTKGLRLAYIHEGETGFMAVFYAPTEVFDEWRPVVDYSIGTFAVFGKTVGE